MDQPNAAPYLILLELGPKRFEPVVEARLGQQVFPEVRQLDPPALLVHGQTLAAELNRAGDEVAIRGTPVLVAERIRLAGPRRRGLDWTSA